MMRQNQCQPVQLARVMEKVAVFPHTPDHFFSDKSGFQELWDRQNSSKASANFVASGNLLP